jgi:hypothetical protein
MVVHNLNVSGLPVLPYKTDPVAVVYSDAVLAGAIFPQGFELKTGTF